MKKYFIAKNNGFFSNLNSYIPYGSILGWDSFSLDQKDTDYLLSINCKINEVDKDIAVFGIRGFGDIRSKIKINYADYEENELFDGSPSLEQYLNNFSKIQIDVSEKRYNTVVKTMKLLAKLIIEDVYEKRFLSLDYSVSTLEKQCWNYQVEGDTKFLEKIAKIKNSTVEELNTLIKTSKENFDRKTQELYLNMIELKQKFYDCKTIRELNVLFEDYMGLPMPNTQAVEEGRYIDMEDGNLPVRKEVIPGFKF